MKKYFILGLIQILLSCEKNDTDDTVIWHPKPIAIINDSEVQLNWFNPAIYNEILRPYEIVDPDKFEIYISTESLDDFDKLIELDNDGEYTYSIDNLENGKIYYFYIISKKKGYSSLPSDTIMAIPNKKTQFEKMGYPFITNYPYLCRHGFSKEPNGI